MGALPWLTALAGRGAEMLACLFGLGRMDGWTEELLEDRGLWDDDARAVIDDSLLNPSPVSSQF